MSQGRQIVTTGSDGLVKIWNLREEECVKTLDGHVEKVRLNQLPWTTAQVDGSLLSRSGLSPSPRMNKQSCLVGRTAC